MSLPKAGQEDPFPPPTCTRDDMPTTALGFPLPPATPVQKQEWEKGLRRRGVGYVPMGQPAAAVMLHARTAAPRRLLSADCKFPAMRKMKLEKNWLWKESPGNKHPSAFRSCKNNK